MPKHTLVFAYQHLKKVVSWVPPAFYWARKCRKNDLEGNTVISLTVFSVMSPITPVICCGVKATTRQGWVCILDYYFIQHLRPHFPNLLGNSKELPRSLLTFEANLLLPVRVSEALLFQYGRDFSLCVHGCLYPVNVDVDKEWLKKEVWNQLRPIANSFKEDERVANVHRQKDPLYTSLGAFIIMAVCAYVSVLKEGV